MPSEEVPDPERQARISQLEARTRRKASVGVKLPTALLAIGGGLFLLWLQWPDLAYFVSPRQAQLLGSEGEYRLEALRSNRYVQIHGVPTLRAAYAQEGSDTFVVVGLRDTPILVRRPALPGEEWKPGRVPPQPDQRPFAVGGRLLGEPEAGRYADGFARFREMGEIRPREGKLWILLEGERPGANLGALGIGLLLLLFIGLNAWFAASALRARG